MTIAPTTRLSANVCTLPGMGNRRRHQTDQRPTVLVLAVDPDDWAAWCHANGYELIAPARMQAHSDPQPRAAQRADRRAHRVIDTADAVTGVGHEVVETNGFPSRPDADELRLLASRQLRPKGG